MNSFIVKSPGILTLFQDSGRSGFYHLGLTNGGPLDSNAFKWANRLCGNSLGTCALEVSMGGLELESQVDTLIAITGANMALTINSKPQELWRTHHIKSGDTISLAYASHGVRSYLAVAGGFTIAPQFGSRSTVCREGVGGLNGDKIAKGDVLPCAPFKSDNFSYDQMLPKKLHPIYHDHVTLRTVPSYQQQHFSSVQQRLFYSSEYGVSQLNDRMGYRLSGQKITSDIQGILSEGICSGAIQIPADGQPIVLLNDRQTIGGYPKIGAVISADTSKLAQLSAGQKVNFEAISMECAHNIHHLTSHLFKQTQLERCS
ncbi:biotin-dependent carboxyltransferase family protein [Thalassotalea profundi]|uniref:Allophanate hydrolase n=1 Tax=Thalassotalea profundi TaxID=2036687 RepID=A0ABQ3IYS1_9GAMM|nr:biotin-dependent carboxyltransferase family protein [Thalassotalea profundi]GHE98720.1 allophanate hydrolase [Thalassotalea profundi]